MVFNCGESPPCEREAGNVHDPYAVSVEKGDAIVGHLPRQISAMCSLFICLNGSIFCEVTGQRRFSRDLPQGGLEIPCRLTFTGEKPLVDKICNLISSAPAIVSHSREISGTISFENLQHQLQSVPAPAVVQNLRDISGTISSENYEHQLQSDESPWIRLDSLILTLLDKRSIIENAWLNENHINFALFLLKRQFPEIEGLNLTLLQSRPQKKVHTGLQIVHSKGNHWITVSTLGEKNEIIVFDSLYCKIDPETTKVILNLFHFCHGYKIVVSDAPKQQGTNDCGLFAIAIASATALLHGTGLLFSQCEMRKHLLLYFEKGELKPFPSDIPDSAII